MPAEHDDSPALELSGLTKSFPGGGGRTVLAVAGVDLRIRRGEVVALLGPNGAGKTTTLDMVLAMTTPDSGSVSVLGRPPRQALDEGRISAVLQTGGLLRDLTVHETVRAVASLYPSPAPVADVMARAGITELGPRRVAKCSGGQQQRLRFALALLPEPDLLVLDEPTAGMDVGARREFWDAMRAEAGRGRTVVFATHYLEEADAFADRIVLMARGRVVADGPTAEIRHRSTRRTVSAHWPGTEAELAALPGVTGIEHRDRRVVLGTDDSDALARLLLTRTGASELEIGTASLEDAFLALTGDQEESVPAEPPGAEDPGRRRVVQPDHRGRRPANRPEEPVR